MIKSHSLKLIKSGEPAIERLKEIFISRQDKYFLQLEDGSYKCIHRKLTDAIIEQHLSKEITLAILPNDKNTTKWICFDVDSKDLNIVSSIVGVLKHHNIRAEIEDSGGKGYHAWIFIKGYIENIFARRFAKFIIGEIDISEDQKRCIEIFPKQDVITEIGSPIKLPWGIHGSTGKETNFINQGLRPFNFDEWHQGLEKVEPRLIKDILEINGIKVDVIEAPPTQFKTPKEIKPCVMKYIEEGVEEGERNTVAFIIATEYRRTGKNREENTAYIINWNKKNKTINKPYTKQEIFNTVNSVYEGYHKHEYGCNNSYLIKNCIGKNKCEYHRKLKRINPSKGKGFNKMIFYKMGWQRILNGSETHMYTSVLSLLEEEKNITPGNWIFTKYEEISYYLGKSKPYVTKILTTLERESLIAWNHGLRGKKHSPTEIRRIIPIPSPPVDSL